MHLAIGTPMYAGQCTAEFNRSATALALSLQKEGSRLTPIYLGNESLIQRARNTIAWHFLQTDASHLLFCDADTGFRVEDVARMVAARKPIIVGPCPMKAINWQRVATAVKAGVPPENLHLYTGIFNVVHLDGSRTVAADEPFEIARGGSGFMLIERGVFEELKPWVDIYLNKNPGDAMPLNAPVHNFFPVTVKDGDLLSEDYGFCDLWRDGGGSIWAAPWCELRHVGAYTFSGTYKDHFAVTETQAA